ncbi:hypothetical protein FACS18942_00520 [Planctomycetales bacterium]|nr:hypothetical protein FACS18942_00520 [Planctomycetales bacterium]
MYLIILTIPIILLYILKLRINTEITATAFLWQQVLQEQRTAPYRQIRRIVSLLLSILFIILLAFAVWNPDIHLPAYKPAVKPKEGIQLAITRFTPRRSLDEPVNYEILTEVSNTGTVSAETILGVQFGSSLLSAQPLTVPANSVRQTVIQGTSPLGGVLQCALIEQEQKENNSRKRKRTEQQTAIQTSAILPPVSLHIVLLFGEDNMYLKNALQSLPDTEIIVPKETPPVIPAAIPKEAVLVINGNVPSELPTGNIIIFNPQNDTQLFSAGESVSIPLAAETDEDSLLVKQLGLANTLFLGAKNITPKITANTKVRILAETAERQPLYLLVETPERKVLVFNADLNKSGITSQTTFPLLLSNALRYFDSSDVKIVQRAEDFSPPTVGSLFAVWFPLTAVCLFWTAAEWYLFLRRKLE